MLRKSRDRRPPRTRASRHPSGQLVHRARLLSQDRALLNPGGGNHSVKATVVDHVGRATPVLWITCWGADSASLGPGDLSCLRMEDLLALRRIAGMSDEQMIDHLVQAQVRADQPRPAIETLTHAFIGAAHVDHTHPMAVIALTAVPDGRRLARDAFGDEAIWLDYRQFDADLARELAERIEAQPSARFVLMANHGLLTWAQTSSECYRNTREAAAGATTRPADLGGPAVPGLDDEAARRLLVAALPALRGAAGAGTRGLVLKTDRSQQARAFASSRRGPQLSLLGPACPDSLVNTGQRPLVVELDPERDGPEELREAFRSGVAAFAEWYESYRRRHGRQQRDGPPPEPGRPGVVVVPGVGVGRLGEDAALAELTEAHFQQTMEVIRATDAAGGYSSLSERQAFEDEHWPLLRNKPQLRPPKGELAGKVVVLAGAADATGQRVARRLAELDAHLVVADADADAAARFAGALVERHGEGRATAARLDSGEPSAAEAVETGVLAFGGVDGLVHVAGEPSRTGPLDERAERARRALDAYRHSLFPVLAAQGTGGAVVAVGAAPELRGPLAGPLEALAAAGAAHGIRVNAVEDDRSHDPAGGTPEAVAFLVGDRSRPWTGSTLGSAAPRRRAGTRR